jgi:hypothetical protein
MAENKFVPVMMMGIVIVIGCAAATYALNKVQVSGSSPPEIVATAIGLAITGCIIGIGVFVIGLIGHRNANHA